MGRRRLGEGQISNKARDIWLCVGMTCFLYLRAWKVAKRPFGRFATNLQTIYLQHKRNGILSKHSLKEYVRRPGTTEQG